jgi:cell wall-associated NlpC family hydrolase
VPTFPENALEVVTAHAPLRREPSPDALLETELLKGERVIVDAADAEGWCHARVEDDGHPGWLPAGALGVPGPAATHKVAVLRTLVFPGPSIKLAPIEALSLGCRLAIARMETPLAVTHAGHYVPARHLVPIETMERDPIAVAERFLDVPYLWGGKTSLGLDCSGLVQLALNACGIACPRNSGEQERTLGAPRALADIGRGDLLYWKGHVAMVRDRDTIIHANAFHMAVVIEPIAEALARIRADGSEITSVRRPK